MEATSSVSTSRTDLSLICAPAVAAFPPPPSFSSTTCTLHEPIKTTGIYTVRCKLGYEITADLRVEIKEQ